MFGAILRSDGRDYREITKGGFFWGLFIGILLIPVSLFMGATSLGTYLLSFVGGIIGTILVFIIGAGIYDLVNNMIDS